MRPIRRERVPCPAEDPVYRLHREQYYGYFPTCWRRFPPGWGCVSPEAPNAAASFKEIPRTRPEGFDADTEPNEPMPPANDREPAPRRDNDATPSPLPPPPSGTRDLFQLDTPKPGNSDTRRSNPPDLPPPSAPANRSTPSSKPSTLLTPPAAEVGLAPREAPTGPGAGEPLLALPEPPATEAPTPPAINAFPEAAPPSSAMSDPATTKTVADAPPEQAPQRRSLLGGLFSGLRRR